MLSGSKHCPTDRDVYLGNVEKVSGVLNFKMALGKVLHGVVSDCLQSFIQRRYYCIQCFGVTRKGEESPSQPELLTVFQISVLLFLITERMDYCM